MKRIRPENALNMAKMLREINKSSIVTFEISKKPWLLTSVYSSYSPDIHIMFLDASPNRYISGPEMIPVREGECLMEFWAATLELIAKRKTVATLHAGYNWSPRGWGKEEEKTGFQSLPTKWHPHLWGWPAFGKLSSFVRQVKISTLTRELRRVLGDNDYAKPFGRLIKKRMRETFSRGSLFWKLFPTRSWHIDGRGIYTRFSESLPDILRTPEFFGEILKPLAAMLEKIMRELTETFTTTRCKDIDRILAKTGRKSKRDLQKLRATPVMREEKQIRSIFKSRGYPGDLFEAILWPVWNRCHEEGNPADWWRKGFAYALVFNGPAKGKRGELRIMPGVYVGPGGVVEAEGYIITRPEDKTFSDEEILRKNYDLRQLAEGLRNFFNLF